MRRTTTFTVTDDGRDKGKVFELTEMSTDQGERWATQATLLIFEARALPVPDELDGSGMAGLAAALGGPASGVLTSVREMKALQDPSLDAMWDCVRYIHKRSAPPQPIADGQNCQIEEIATRRQLRLEVLKLHTGFFLPESPSRSATSPTPSS